MEKQFFDWVDWNQQDTACLSFFPCTLKVDIGKHLAGTVIPCITIDAEHGVMDFTDDEGKHIDSFNLKYAIAE